MKPVTLVFSMVAFAATLLGSSLGSIANATSRAPIPILAVLESPNGADENVNSATLRADGFLLIARENGGAKFVKVAPQDMADLTDITRRLSDVQLIETRSLVVCMMVATPSLSLLSVSPYHVDKARFEGTPRTVLTSQDCTQSYTVIPKDPVAAADAQVLRAKIRELAVEGAKAK